MKDTKMTQTFKPMRSVAPDWEKFPITFPKLASPKLDGIRLCKWQGKVVTKSGKQIPNKFVRQWLKYRSMTYGVKDAPRHGRFLCWRDESDV